MIPRFRARRNQADLNSHASPQTSGENEDHPASAQNTPTVILNPQEDFAAIQRRIRATRASRLKEEAQKLADRVEELQQGLAEMKRNNLELKERVREMEAQCAEYRGRRAGAEK